MNGLSTIRRVNDLAVKRALTAVKEPSESERTALVAQARENNAQPALTEHEESLMLPGETPAEFLERKNRDA